MKTWMNGMRRGLYLLAGSLAVAATIGAPLCGARAGSDPDLRREGLRSEGVRPEGLLSALRANGAGVLPLGVRGGLHGYFVKPARGTGYSLYVTGDGHAVAGLLYGPDGTAITGAQLAAARPAAASEQRGAAATPKTLVPETLVPRTLVPQSAAPAMTAHAASDTGGPASPSPSLTRMFERSAAAFGFTLGERGPVVVLLGDPACSFSRAAAARLGRAALEGRVQLRVVPVGVLGGTAARRAVAIAAHPDPARAWFEGDGTADRTLGPETLGPETGAGRIARNNALLDEWGATAVPLIAWRTRHGAVGHRVGDMEDIDAWLVETGLE